MNMGRNKINPEDLKRVVSVRLSNKIINDITKLGNKQQIIEDAIQLLLKIRQNTPKSD